jgi:hypothetical protein
MTVPKSSAPPEGTPMGSVFEQIADAALIPLDATYYSRRQVCNQTKPVHVTYGRALLKGKK